MEACCDLQVDVNGEETFRVDKRLISKYSGRLRNLFGKSADSTENLKVIFHDFPGGAESFELITKFCYNQGKIDINTCHISVLHCAARFMEMKSSVSGSCNLMELTEKSLEEIGYWTWSELLTALKQCQDLLPESGLLEKLLDSIVGRLALAGEASPCLSSSSTDSSGFRFSCDTRSSESLRSSFSRASWWFEDLLVLNPTWVQMLTKSMILRKFDQVVLSRFLFYYQKSKFCNAATSEEKCQILETVVDILYLLDSGSVSGKSLFGTLQAALSLKTSKCCRKKLESMIGSQMDQATLDNLLVPSPCGTSYLYDVNLVLHFVKAFLRHEPSLKPLRKVGSLMDLYIAEVAPDPCLKPSKFLTLLKALPGPARDSHDDMYRAIDTYLKVHRDLSEDDKMEICCALNYEKLSAEASKHISQNSKFPSTTAVQASLSKQIKLISLARDRDSSGACTKTGGQGKKKDEASDQMVLYAGKIDLTDDNEKLKAHLQGMQWRVMELENVCRKMQTQMSKVMKSRVPNQKSTRSLPKLCS